MAQRGRPKKMNTNLLDAVLEVDNPEDALESIVQSSDDSVSEALENFEHMDAYTPPEQTDPTPSDPEWNDFVFKHFKDEELINNNPNTAALRRVTELLVGPILNSTVDLVIPPSSENGFRATVICRIELEEFGKYRVYSDVADSVKVNTPAPFDKHLTATAATRAEGRVLRKILKLRAGIVAAEELAPEATEDDNWEPELIGDQQITFLDTIGSRINVDLGKFINMGKRTYANVREIPFGVAQQMIQKLSEYQREGKAPEHLLGYKKDWEK